MSLKLENIEITQASFADLEQVAGLFDLYRQFYRQPSDLSEARAFIGARLEAEESVIFIARVVGAGASTGAGAGSKSAGSDGASGEIAGFVQLYPSFSSLSMRRTWVLNDLYVATDYRKLGIARRLIEVAREHGVKTGAKRLSLSTARDNAPARALYERLGWKLDETYLGYGLELG